MIKTAILISFLILVSLTAFSQKNVNSLVVVSYNVENLFDTVNSPLFDDDAFTPAGSKKWTYDRYKKKLNDLAMVFSQEWMLYDNEKYGAKLPSSTYGGPNYYGGPSDHLPVYVTFTW